MQFYPPLQIFVFRETKKKLHRLLFNYLYIETQNLTIGTSEKYISTHKEDTNIKILENVNHIAQPHHRPIPPTGPVVDS